MHQPKFHLRSNRDYLHSATVFDAVLDVLEYIPADLDFLFHKKTIRNCFLSETCPTEGALIAEYVDAKRSIYVVEGEGEIEDTQDYDDKLIVESCDISGKTASILVRDTRFSAIESIIAAYKFLLQELFGHDRKYVFARISLSKIPQDKFSVKHRRKMSSDFYQADIYEADTRLGFILFGEWYDRN